MAGAEIPELMEYLKWKEERKRVPHLGHASHLCNLVDLGIDIDTYKNLVKKPKFLCKKCGRVATSEKNLCEPIPL